MDNRLFLVCPSDFMEPEINRDFEGNNYFYTALANNYHYGELLIREIGDFIQRKNISEIVFVSDFRNKLFVNYLTGRVPSYMLPAIRELQYTLRDCHRADNRMENHIYVLKFMVSNHLCCQVSKLKRHFYGMPRHIKITAFLYDREHRTYVPIDKYLLLQAGLCSN